MNEETSRQVSRIKENALGICAVVFSILSLFNIVLFAPLTIIMAVIAFIKKQRAFAISALTICVIAIATSKQVKMLFLIFRLKWALSRYMFF